MAFGSRVAIHVGVPEIVVCANWVARKFNQDGRRTVRTPCRLRGL